MLITFIITLNHNFDVNKSEFQAVVKLRYKWEVPDTPSIFVCGDIFNVDYAMICKCRWFVIQRNGHYDKFRDLQAEPISMVCKDVEVEPVMQDITGEELNRGANTTPDALKDIAASWSRPDI